MILKMYEDGLYGAPTDPERFDEDELMERRAEYGAAGYQLQFMLNTKLSDEERFPLKLKNIIVTPVPPEQAPHEVHWLPADRRFLKDLPTYGMAGDKFYEPAGESGQFSEYQHRVMSIDPSGRGRDETGFAVGFMLSGNIWVPEAGGFAGGYEPQTLEALTKIAKRHKVQTIVVESNFGDGMFERLLEPVLLKHGVTAEVIGVRHSTMKEMRILDTLEPVVSGHKLIVDPEVIKRDHETIKKYETNIRQHKSLFYQMTRICREKGALRFDDRVDALAILVKHFTDMMAQDGEKTAQAQYEERLAAEMAAFHGQIVTWGDPERPLSEDRGQRSQRSWTSA